MSIDWKTPLGSEPTRLALPVDRARPAHALAGAVARRDTLELVLDDSRSAALAAFACAREVTPSLILLAAWQVLLHRLTNDREITVAVAGIDGLADGSSVRAELAPTLSFEQLIRATRESLRVARAAAVESLGSQVGYGHGPRATGSAWPATTELSLQIEAAVHGNVSGRLTYDSELFEPASVERWSRQFVRLLGLLLERPGVALGVLPWLDAAEREALLAAGARREQIEDSPLLHERIAAHARRAPTRLACSFEGAWLSYGALEQRANQWAHRLRAVGVGPEVRVGLFVERSFELVVGILAILKAGGAYVPLDPAAPADRLAYTAADSQLALVLTDSASAERLVALASVDVRLLDREDVSAEPTSAPTVRTGPDSLAYVIYTSGSTGKPKGALLTHRNVTRLFDSTQRWFAWSEHDVWSLFHSYTFDLSVWELFGALLYGGTCAIVPHDVSRSPLDFHALLVRERVTVLTQTPTAFRQLSAVACDAPAEDELALRWVVFGGEALEPESLRPWFERFGDTRPQLVNMYGITETTVHVTYRPLTRADLARPASSPIGEPIMDLALHVLDEALEPCAWGATGELYVGGDGLARGYWRRPGLTAERFIPNPFGSGRLYRSGDLALRRRDGSLEFLGRSDHQVKIRGFRVELGEISAQLQMHPLVRDAVVITQPGPSGPRLAGYVTLHSNDDTDVLDTLRQHLLRALPDYMLPATLTVLSELPLTLNGKLDRRRLLELPERTPSPAAAPSGERAAASQLDALDALLTDLESES